MLTYVIEKDRSGNRCVEKELHVEGDVSSRDIEKLYKCFFDALNDSEHLIVNIEKTGEFDCSFIMLVCSIRNTARLLNKKLTIHGRTMGHIFCEHETAVQHGKSECVFANTPGCFLWESIFKAIPRSREK